MNVHVKKTPVLKSQALKKIVNRILPSIDQCED